MNKGNICYLHKNRAGANVQTFSPRLIGSREIHRKKFCELFFSFFREINRSCYVVAMQADAACDLADDTTTQLHQG